MPRAKFRQSTGIFDRAISREAAKKPGGAALRNRGTDKLILCTLKPELTIYATFVAAIDDMAVELFVTIPDRSPVCWPGDAYHSRELMRLSGMLPLANAENANSSVIVILHGLS